MNTRKFLKFAEETKHLELVGAIAMKAINQLRIEQKITLQQHSAIDHIILNYDDIITVDGNILLTKYIVSKIGSCSEKQAETILEKMEEYNILIPKKIDEWKEVKKKIIQKHYQVNWEEMIRLYNTTQKRSAKIRHEFYRTN
ncbi:hypothetical protein [Acetobacter syzygii]|uniref:hypothetical protein n=1 Tax=Acetobacter syzygii TaxID=146476 RepID=UPI0039EC2969